MLKARSQVTVPVGAGPASGASPLLVVCSYQPPASRPDGSGDDGAVSSDEDEDEAGQPAARVALERASPEELTSVVTGFLEKGADVNAADGSGRTPGRYTHNPHYNMIPSEMSHMLYGCSIGVRDQRAPSGIEGFTGG